MFLENLGVFGVEKSSELAILSGLLLGEPVLLIGKNGTAKTVVVNGFGAAIREYYKRKFPDDRSKWFQYQVYDASKINFEDLIGLPNPKSLMEGRQEFIDSPLTIWGKKLICFDEFNRQTPERQNNIFEVLRSRRCMGIPIQAIWILNAMNPQHYVGAEELDEALVDRHLCFISFDDYTEMSRDIRSRISRMVSSDDAPALKLLSNKKGAFDVEDTKVNDKLADTGGLLLKVLKRAAKAYHTIEEGHGNQLAGVVDDFIISMINDSKIEDKSLYLSGRRAGMYYRGILAQLALVETINDLQVDSLDFDLEDCIQNAISLGTPLSLLPTTREDLSYFDSLMSSTLTAILRSERRSDEYREFSYIYKALTSKSITEIVEILFTKVAKMSSDLQTYTFEKLLNKFCADPNKQGPDVIFSYAVRACAATISDSPNILNIASRNNREVLGGNLKVTLASSVEELVDEHFSEGDFYSIIASCDLSRYSAEIERSVVVAGQLVDDIKRRIKNIKEAATNFSISVKES